MKKTLLAAAVLLTACLAAYAQDAQTAAEEAAKALAAAEDNAEAAAQKPTYWTLSSDFGLGFNQTTLTNWAAGGYNTLTLAASVDAKANYAKGLMSWNNNLQLNYGFLYAADKKGLVQKNVDRLYLNSIWGLDLSATSKWKYTAAFEFRSQFAEGYGSYTQDETTKKWQGNAVSSFLAPAYTTLGIGMEWKPNSWFAVNIAPLTGGFNICIDDRFKKAYGMKLVDETVPDVYKSAIFQLGAQAIVNASASINDVLNYQTKFVIFTDYLDHPFEWNRINWDNKISWTISKMIKLGFDTWLIYDPLVKIVNEKDIATYPEGTQRVQFKEFFAINLTYSISAKK